ncbi:MAG: hypothetical protein AAGD43_33160, partial [Pseudomonadota bacterium]
MDANTYFAIGIVAGLLLIFEGVSLRGNGGRLTSLIGVLTVVELGWLVLCIYVLLQTELPGWTTLIPAAYLAYFVIAAWHFSRVANFDETTEFSDIRIPMSFAMLEIYTGAGLVVLCGLAWVQFAEQLAR